VKDPDEPLGEISFVPFFDDIVVDYEPGTAQQVAMHDGSKLYLKKVGHDYDPTDKVAAQRVLQETSRRGEFATGLLYIEPGRPDFLACSTRRGAPCEPARRAGPPPQGARRIGGPGVGLLQSPAWNTLAIIKPMPCTRLAGRIIDRIEQSGLRFVRWPVRLTRTDAGGFYAVIANARFRSLTEHVVRTGPCRARE
jgi:hypothetical protein